MNKNNMIENNGMMTSVSLSRSTSCSDSNDDEDSTVQEIEDYCESQPGGLPTLDTSNLATTVVKMKNSSNVEIKPVTRVTIHQYFQNSDQLGTAGTIPTISEYCDTGKAKTGQESEPHVTLNTSKKKFYHAITSNLSWKLGLILTVIVVSIVVVTVVCLIVLSPKDDEMPYTPKPENSSGLEETDYDLGNDIHIFTRHRWSGHAILDGYQNRTLVHPINLVIIGHTVSPQCMKFETCASRLQSIQSQHVGEWDYVDIGYNFLVGGDGNIYQALGWDIRNYLKNNSIQIQFIGNYVFDKVLDRQRMGLQALLKLGVKLGKLDQDYLLVAHSQVSNTLSPGKNLLKELKLWPHYSNLTFT